MNKQYLTNEARKDAIQGITGCIEAINTCPGLPDKIGTLTVDYTVGYLKRYRQIVSSELAEENNPAVSNKVTNGDVMKKLFPSNDTPYDSKLMDLFKRTLSNCEFYENENRTTSLLNEIGVLRGIAYCLEALNIDVLELSSFQHYIEIQNQELNKITTL